MDRIFRRFGLGKSFIPMLVGTDGVRIMASQTIGNLRDRRMTIMTIPYPRGAKLPIIALMPARCSMRRGGGSQCLLCGNCRYFNIGLFSKMPFEGTGALCTELPAYMLTLKIFFAQWDMAVPIGGNCYSAFGCYRWFLQTTAGKRRLGGGRA